MRTALPPKENDVSQRMWCIATMVAIIFSVGGVTAARANDAAPVDGLAAELEFLRPLLGPPRVGSYVDSAPGELEMTVQWDVAHSGHVVRFTKSVPEADFTSETLYYWDMVDERVVFVSVCSRGIMSRGEVREEYGSVVLTGTESWADQDIEFRLTFTALPGGAVRDVYERFEGERFVPGHVIEYRPHPR